MEELLRRHKQERKVQRQESNALLQGTKGAERKAAEQTIKGLVDVLAARHDAEKLALENPDAAADAAGNAEGEQQQVAADSSAAQPASALDDSAARIAAKKNKNQKKRDKKKDEEAARRELVAQAKAGMGPTPRELEMDAINEKLKPIGLRIRDVKADGHCMYRALADQLAQTGYGAGLSASVEEGEDNEVMYKRLRAMCAQFIEANRVDFAPFVETDEESIEQYCVKVRDTAEWGGQVELEALTRALQLPVVVHAAAAPDLIVGGEFMREVEGEPMHVTYHKHYYALGEHYNAVERIVL